MARKKVPGEVVRIFDHATKEMAQYMKKVMYESAKNDIIGNDGARKKGTFYGDYEPLYYKRVGNLENSFRGYVREGGGNPHGVEYSAYVKFSTKYMKQSHHLKINGGGEYDKAAVMIYDFDNGWHGAPISSGLFEPENRRRTWWGKDRGTGDGRRMIPSPAERMELLMDSYVNNPVKINRIADEAFNKAMFYVADAMRNA